MMVEPPAFRPPYDPQWLQPLRDELVAVGLEELRTPEEVDAALEPRPGTVLLVVNSVCGCAAAGARPAVMLALQHRTIPDRLVSVFAGQDSEATSRVRDRYLRDYAPSSPCIVLFRDGGVHAILERHNMEGRNPREIARLLTDLFDDCAGRPGPSVPEETFRSVFPGDPPLSRPSAGGAGPMS